MTDDNVTDFPQKKRPPGPGRGHKIKQGSGIPASGIPASGMGWGGSPTGKGAGVEALIPGQSAEKRAVSEYNRRTDEERAMEMRQVLYDVATASEFDAVRISAADKLLNRIEGTPVSRSILAGDPDAPLVPERRTLDLNQLSADQRAYVRNIIRIASSESAQMIEPDEEDEE